MRLHPLRDIGAEAQIVLRTFITPRNMHEVNRADDVSMTAKVIKAHQNGTLSVSTM